MKTNPSKQYDDMAELYAQKNESSLHNALYERPATKAIMPDITNNFHLSYLLNYFYFYE